MTAPADKRRFCIVVIGEIIFRNIDFKPRALVTKVFALERVGVVPE